MSTLTIRDIDEEYLDVLGSNISYYNSSTEVLKKIDENAFQTNNSERLRYGWIDEITFEIKEQDAIRFCSETVDNLRNESVSFDEAQKILQPFQYASGIKYQNAGINKLKSIFSKEQYDIIDEIINSTHHDISRDRVVTDIYKANLYALKNDALFANCSILLNYYFGKGCGVTNNIFNEYNINTAEIPMYKDISAKPFTHDLAYPIIKVLYEIEYNSKYDEYTPIKPLYFPEEDEINQKASEIYSFY